MLKGSVPRYCLHKATRQAYVKLHGKRHYLGLYGSPDSHESYARLISEWQARQSVQPSRVTIGMLTLLYLEHAKGYYVKDGAPTGHLHIVRNALRYLNDHCRRLLVQDFSPKKLSVMRNALVERGKSRKYINDLISVIKRMLKWGIEEELVPPSDGVNAVLARGVCWLKEGRSKAREPQPVRPVCDEHIEAVQPYVNSIVWGMIGLQRRTGCRPGEALIIRGRDIDMSCQPWEYVPERHKTEHHDKKRVILIGPKEQFALREFLVSDPAAFLFSSDGSGRTPYRRDSYRNAILRACELAFEMPKRLRRVDGFLAEQPDLTEVQRAELRATLLQEAAIWRQQHCWSPNRLRHRFATDIRRAAGIEQVRILLGHDSIDTSELYAELELESVRELVCQIG